MFKYIADILTFGLFRLSPGTHLAESVNFFIYDVLKIAFFILLIMAYVVYHATHGGHVGDIHRMGQATPSQASDLPGGAAGCLRAVFGHDDDGSFARQSQGDTFPDSLACASNNGNFPR